MLRLSASMAFLISAHAAGAQNQPMAQDQPPVAVPFGGATMQPNFGDRYQALPRQLRAEF
jgi:hypothetical protein